MKREFGKHNQRIPKNMDAHYRQLCHNLNEVSAEHDSSDRDHHVAVLIKHLEVSNHPECHHHLLEQYTLMVYNGLYI
uniref:Uncharacterized protein n=1 Tax=Glossina pallidipes TaxID=7398 RepID=A0A1A9ZEY9_GLOPL